jgi:hypothetical protein
MQFDARLAAMPAYFRRTQFLYEALRAHPAIRSIRPARRPTCCTCTCR